MGVALPTYAMINLSAVQTVAAGTEVRLDLLNLADTSYQVRDRTGVGVGAPQFGIRRAILGGWRGGSEAPAWSSGGHRWFAACTCRTARHNRLSGLAAVNWRSKLASRRCRQKSAAQQATVWSKTMEAS